MASVASLSAFGVLLIALVNGDDTSSLPFLLTREEQNIADACFNSTSCDANSKYRTIDGSCNNLNKPWWGAANTPYVHLLKPAYKDSNNSFRVSVVDGSELPGARLLSSTFLEPLSTPILDEHTRMFMVFSQLLAHDILNNPQSSGNNCCSDTGDSVVSTSDNCHPIVIPDTDPFYSQFGRKCQEFHQSAALSCPALPPSHPLLPKAFTSHYADASFLYGQTDDAAKALRTLTDGKLRIQDGTPGQYLPFKDASACPFNKRCYDGGDPRGNQHLDLTVMETVFLRYHNFVVDKLVAVNPQLASKDEILYQEARRFVIATWQHIVYNEWLTLFLGPEHSAGLASHSSGYSDIPYDPELNPSSLADFAGAAFRVLHAYTPNNITVNSKSMPFSTTLLKSADFLQEGDTFDSDIHSLLSEHPQQLNHYYSHEVTQKLFFPNVPRFNGTFKFGDDLASIDIQRGRDYGLRSFNDYRQGCDLPKFNDFESMASVFGSDKAHQLSQLFKHPDDVDFYLASLYELTTLNSTFAKSSLQCVWIEEFRRLKYGDRFFYDFANQKGSFTLDQLAVIKNFKLSHILCAGLDKSDSSIQANAFYPADANSNPLIPCPKLLEQIDFSKFQISSS